MSRQPTQAAYGTPVLESITRIDAKNRLILALDVPNDQEHPDRLIEREDAVELVEKLEGLISFVKIGWPLYMAGGHAIITDFIQRGKRVFLDLKFGDIAETVKRLVRVAERDGVEFITVNASFDAVRAAVAARATGSKLKILTVTMLTSWNETDLRELGIVNTTAEQMARHKTSQAQKAGCDGVISSGREVKSIREIVGEDFLIITPGIRPAGARHDDHKRATTPTESIQAGADYLVVGRPIATAPDPVKAAHKILDEMQTAFDARTMSRSSRARNSSPQ